jgi:hypothetical protein
MHMIGDQNVSEVKSNAKSVPFNARNQGSNI